MSNLPTKYDRGELDRRPKKGLYRDTEDNKFLGVCSGLAKWSGVPSIVWRLGFILTALIWGAGFLVYPLVWLAMDKAPPKPEPEPEDLSPEDKEIWEAVREEMDSLKAGGD